MAVVGCGQWGQNLARVFHRLGALRWICDADPGRLSEVGGRLPGARSTTRIEDVLADDAARAIAVATPANTHFAVARAALAAGRDVFVEKPLALSAADGAWLVHEAAKRRAILMVGHVLRYHPAVVRLKELLDAGELGDLYYFYSNRLNLGRIRRDENILWSFAPHDVSVMLLLVGRMPTSVSACGRAYLQPEIADVTLSTYAFGNDVQGHIFVSWLHPFKEQRLVVVGSRKMALFNDVATDAAEKLCIYDKGVTWRDGAPLPRLEAETRILLPAAEPLDVECRHFLECLEQRTSPQTDGAEGVRVLQVLEASQQSLLEGRPVAIAPSAALVDA